jgi:uncharacterized protein with PIN domain
MRQSRITGFCSFSTRGEIAMRVDPAHGRCRECDGELSIIDADDATMTVECRSCTEVYLVEMDAFGDGAMDYHTGFLTGCHPERLP